MKIVVTGGVASGKTAVTDYLKTKGFAVIDADRISRELTVPGSELLSRLVEAFGKRILTEDGGLNRRALREWAFATPEKTALLNLLTHESIRRAIEERLKETQGDVAVAVPLYFEAGWNLSGIDRVWTIACRDDLRIKRLCERDNISEDRAAELLARQWTDEMRAARADVVIRNESARADLIDEIERALKGGGRI